MAKSVIILVAAGFAVALGGFATLADAKSKSITGFCSIKGGRAPCNWVEKCLLEGGIPERRPFCRYEAAGDKFKCAKASVKGQTSEDGKKKLLGGDIGIPQAKQKD